MVTIFIGCFVLAAAFFPSKNVLFLLLLFFFFNSLFYQCVSLVNLIEIFSVFSCLPYQLCPERLLVLSTWLGPLLLNGWIFSHPVISPLSVYMFEGLFAYVLSLRWVLSAVLQASVQYFIRG